MRQIANVWLHPSSVFRLSGEGCGHTYVIIQITDCFILFCFVGVFILKEMKRNTLFSLRTVAHSFRRLQLLRLVLNVPGEISEVFFFGYHSSLWSLMAVSGKLFEAGCLLTFSAFRIGAYSNKYGTYVEQALFCRVFQVIEGKGEKITPIRKVQLMKTQVVNYTT